MKIKTKFSLILLIFFFCCTCCGSGFSNNNAVIVTFEYKDKIWCWSEDALLKNTKVFEHYGQFQKNGRGGSGLERVELIQDIVKAGFTYDEAFEYCFTGMIKTIHNICKTINRKPVDATLKFNPNRAPSFILTKDYVGYDVDKMSLYHSVLNQLKSNNKVHIIIEPVILQPQVKFDDLKELTQLKSSFSTNFSSSGVNRKHNVRKSLNCFNGMVLEPFGEYSFNTITKRRTTENGYLPANIIVNEEYIEGVGGGVCQTSTTLYNALLLAGVKIIESHPHSLQSSYVMSGFDAMVNFGSSDLRWQNCSQNPIFIKTWTTNTSVCVEVYGKKENEDIEIKRANKIVKEISPKSAKIIKDREGEYADKVFYEDESWIKTYAKKGAEVYSYLQYWKHGKMIDEKLVRKQIYKAVQEVVIQGCHKRAIIDENEYNNEYPIKNNLFNAN